MDFLFYLVPTFMVIVVIVKIVSFSQGKTDRNSTQNQNFMQNQQQDALNQQMLQEQLRQQNEIAQQTQEEQFRQNQQWFMDESQKSVTPFEQGGYNLNNGNSFNDQFNNQPPNMF